MKKIILLILPMLFFISQFSFFNKNKVVYADNISSEIVMDVKSHRVLYSKNIDTKKYMASTTKILTALCIIENCNLDEIITVKKETTGIEGSSIYLEEGEQLSVRDLLYGLMLRSGNDCAETLAIHCSKTKENFAILMNETAKKYGAKSSNFVTPHGLHDDNHYTTAYDLALISCFAIQNPEFKKIVSTKKIYIPFTTRNTKRLLINKNKMLNELEGATGIKTGYTKKAGRCLVTSCERNKMELVSVVLNCSPMFEESKNIINNAFNEYIPYLLEKKDNIIDFIKIENKEKIPVSIKDDVILPLRIEERNNLNQKIILNKDIKFPISKDEPLGEIQFFYQNNLIFSQKLYSIIDIK